MNKTIDVQILTSDVFVMDNDAGAEIWIPAVPTAPLSVEDSGEVVVSREVHKTCAKCTRGDCPYTGREDVDSCPDYKE